jgi:hypothetical protein
MKLIPLYGRNGVGKFAQVDDEDYEYLIQWRWFGVYVPTSRNYYVTRNSTKDLKATRMHTIIMGKKEGLVIDHVDGDGLNNQRSNLRHCTNIQNSYNRRNYKNSSSKYKGVCKHGNKYHARIGFNKKHIHLGTFTSEDDAALAYNKKAKELFGEYANLNCINGGTRQSIKPPPKFTPIKKEIPVYEGELPPNSRAIPLSKGKFAIVSEEDYEWLNQWNWLVLKKSINYYSAVKNGKRLGGGKREPQTSMHAFIMNPKKGMVVDHINRNPLDNRRENLRVVTQLVNIHNTSRSLRNPKYYIQLKCI